MADLRIPAKVTVVEVNHTDVSSIVTQRTLDMVAGRQLARQMQVTRGSCMPLGVVIQEWTPVVEAPCVRFA